MITLEINQVAKHLRESLRALAPGEYILLCEGKIPVARILPAGEEPKLRKKKRILGQWKGQVTVTADAFDPLSENEMKKWEGEE